MPKLHAQVVETLPAHVNAGTEYAVLYIRASDNLDAIDCANDWAAQNGFERARELTLGQASRNNQMFYVARCYRKVPGER